jgi:hypothetical protein
VPRLSWVFSFLLQWLWAVGGPGFQTARLCAAEFGQLLQWHEIRSSRPKMRVGLARAALSLIAFVAA